tara:strand:+ start:119 stop:1243 length:1125 start_codon:yes stop_codon:yes gene_type:complete
MKIALISVAPPYRGGISKHTTILAQKLSHKHSVDIINYKRQYPKLLFPGKTQYLENISSYKSNFRLIDTINPISWYKTANLIIYKNYDLVIFRFWNPFFAPALGLIAKIIKKHSSTTKLISLCDNIIPHEKLPLSNYFIKFLFNKLDGHIVQSSQTEEELNQIVYSPKYKKSLHPIYNTYKDKVNKNKARLKLKLKSKNIILFFGIIRDYKGLDILIKSLGILKKNKDFHLMIAGECYGKENKYQNLISSLDLSNYITWYNRYIPDDQINIYFSAADVVILPYKSASQSGIAQIAYNYDIPIIVSNIKGLAEIVQNGKSGFVFESENYTNLAEILDDNLGTSNFDSMGKFISNYKFLFSWENFIESIESLYKNL